MNRINTLGDIFEKKNNILSSKVLTFLVKTITQPALVVELSTNIVTMNHEAMNMLGIKSSNPKKGLQDFLPHETGEIIRKKFSDLLRGDKSWDEGYVPIDVTGSKHKLVIIPVRITGIQTAPPLNAFLLVFKTGIMESEESHDAKMATVGEFAAGIAHELNTPLANISLIAENILEVIQDENVKKEMKKIMSQVDFSARIVRELLAFSRKGKPTFEQIDLHGLINEVIDSLKYERKYKVHLQMKEDLPTVKGDPFQLQEIFMNVIQNAKDAMRDGGEIFIRSRFDEKWVEIDIEDKGDGIPREMYEKVFQPFYTTKPHGQGVGLGLAICKNIIINHKGDIKIRSRPFKGTTFIIRLPRGE